MNIHNPHRAIFSSLKTALVHHSGNLPQERGGFDGEESVLATGTGTVSANSMAFGGDGTGTVEIKVHPGSYVDNQPLTEDSVEFTFGENRYQSYQYNESESGANGHSLRILHEGSWRRTDGIWSKPANS